MAERNSARFGTVAIVGVGLIGGSIGLALRKRKLAETVIGIGRRESSFDGARAVGAVTETTTDLAQGVARADLVIVCTPVSTVVEFVRAAADAIPSGSIITDAASTKASIVAALQPQVAAGLPFVGSHPIAGSHLTGAAAADPELFVDRDVIVTPTANTESNHTKTVAEFWTALGAKTHEMDAEQHDKVLASTSHLPHLIATALASVTPEKALPFTGTGWDSTTRVASGSPDLWVDILKENRNEILLALTKFGEQCDAFRDALQAGNDETIHQLLDQGKERRDAVGN